MAQFVCYDSSGNELNYFYQWDTNRVIRVDKLPKTDATVYAHFCNKRSEEAHVVNVELVDNGCTTIVPNSLLIHPDNIIFYLSQSIRPNEKITLQRIVIPVIPRPMPPEYIYQNELKGKIVANGLTDSTGALSLSIDGTPFGASVTI